MSRVQFGNRILTGDKNVFEHNAWDNVSWDAEQEKEAFQRTQEQFQQRMDPQDQVKYEDGADTYWDEFYSQHQNKFFKDRHWLFTEFPELYGDKYHTKYEDPVSHSDIPSDRGIRTQDTRTNAEVSLFDSRSECISPCISPSPNTVTKTINVKSDQTPENSTLIGQNSETRSPNDQNIDSNKLERQTTALDDPDARPFRCSRLEDPTVSDDSAAVQKNPYIEASTLRYQGEQLPQDNVIDLEGTLEATKSNSSNFDSIAEDFRRDLRTDYGSCHFASSDFVIFEVGCGVGNTVFPILRTCPKNVKIYCCDFSSMAINILKDNLKDTDRCHAFVCDVCDENVQFPFPSQSLNIVVLIFVLSAIKPSKMAAVVKRLAVCLKPGGRILFRDYGRYDMAQLRFKNERCLSQNFYVRGDGTCVYFFTQDEVRSLFVDAGLIEEQNIIDRRLQVNRGRQLKMYRVWIQSKYRAPGGCDERI